MSIEFTPEESRFYDSLIYVTTTNLYTLSKSTQSIYLNSFNPLDSAHLTVFHAAQLIHSMYGFKLYVDMPFFAFLKFKFTHRALKRGRDNGKTCDEIISDIEVPNNAVGAFAKIYEAYYKT